MDFKRHALFTAPKHLHDLDLHSRVILRRGGQLYSEWLSFMGKCNWCRSQKVDKIVADKFAALGLEGCSTGFVTLDAVATIMVRDMVERCSLPFDH